MKSKIPAEMEENEILGELQCGCRQGRRWKDTICLHSVMMAEGKPLGLTPLDIKGAHDNVSVDLLMEYCTLKLGRLR